MIKVQIVFGQEYYSCLKTCFGTFTRASFFSNINKLAPTKITLVDWSVFLNVKLQSKNHF
jgi:hypothetical protein